MAMAWVSFLEWEEKRRINLGHLSLGTRDFVACNHLRSYKYYSDSIVYPDGFLGYACASYDQFQAVSISQSLGMDPVEKVIKINPFISFPWLAG